MKIIIKTVLLSFFSFPICFAQVPCDEPSLDPDCVLCTADGFEGNTQYYSPGFPGPSFPCGTLENTSFWAFYAADTTVFISLIGSNCVLGQGLQAIIYDEAFNPASNCFSSGGTNIPGVLNIPTAIPGNLYYLMVDGWAGDFCDFRLELHGVANDTTFPVGSAGQVISVPDREAYCGRDTVCLAIDSVPGAIRYEWSFFEKVEIASSGFEEVVPGKTFFGGREICFLPNVNTDNFVLVTPIGICNEGFPARYDFSTYEDFRITIQIDDICDNGFPVTIDDHEFPFPGTYTIQEQSAKGCDSTIVYEIGSQAFAEENYFFKLCDGESIQLYDSTYFEPIDTQFWIIDTSGQVCDTLINLQIQTGTSTEVFDTIVRCDDDLLTVQNQLLNESGEYTFNFLSDFGCDSIYNLYYSVLPTPSTTIDTTIHYLALYQGIQVLGDTVFQRVEVAANGCDSVVTHVVRADRSPVKDVINYRPLHIFPNPATHQVIIKLQGRATAGHFQLFDALGSMIPLADRWNFKGGTYQINLTDLSSGSYFLIFRDAEKREFRMGRFVKM